MKIRNFTAIVISSFLAIGTVTTVASLQPIPVRAATLIASLTGSFETVSKPTSGTVTIIEEDGKRYLEFDDTFSSDNGPDLFVLLHKEANPRTYSPDQYVNLGTLQSLQGQQRYEIPEDVSVEDFKSAVVWCRQFNVTFGVATF